MSEHIWTCLDTFGHVWAWTPVDPRHMGIYMKINKLGATTAFLMKTSSTNNTLGEQVTKSTSLERPIRVLKEQFAKK